MGRAGFGDKVEGLHAVAAAAAAGRVEVLRVEKDRLHRPPVREIIDSVEAFGGSVSPIDDVRSLADTTAPQGVVARCSPIPFVSLEEVAAAVIPTAMMVVDHVVDPHNLGAIVRSSVAAGVLGLVVAERRAAPLNGTAFKAAAGALEQARVASVGSVAEALSHLKKLDVWSVGLDSAGPERLFGLALLTEPVALVVGEEGGGLSRLVAERVDVLAAVPMEGTVESLNVSVAAALAAFEIFRVRS